LVASHAKSLLGLAVGTAHGPWGVCTACRRAAARLQNAVAATAAVAAAVAATAVAAAVAAAAVPTA
jgi:hypothetical protein